MNKIAFVAFTTAAAIALVGCGGDGEPDADDGAGDAEAVAEAAMDAEAALAKEAAAEEAALAKQAEDAGDE